MRRKVEVGMTPGEMAELGEVARHMQRTKADALRVLVRQAHTKLVAERGETRSNMDETKRGE